MRLVGLVGAFAFAILSCPTLSAAQAHDESKYPDWSGQWRRRPGMPLQWDTTKPMGRGQAGAADAGIPGHLRGRPQEPARGRTGHDPRYGCLPQGMPRVMSVLFPMEFLIGPKTTHILFENHYPRRIYTDGRDWPKGEIEPAFVGYSLGTWIDQDGDGRYDLLEAETRHIRGPRTFEPSGLPLHADNKTVVKERIYLDKASTRASCTTRSRPIDNALTRPWTVKQSYRRETRPEIWVDNTCGEFNSHVIIGKEHYFLSGDRLLMPVRKNQPPPDLRYFNDAR